MIQWAIFIIHVYVWLNPTAPSSVDYFEPCNSNNIEKYAIKDEKKLDFFQDCVIINGQVANKLLSVKAFKTEKEKQDYIDKVRKYYDKK
jgi:hypothetical protein